jgi:hypothetical protein
MIIRMSKLPSRRVVLAAVAAVLLAYGAPIVSDN